MFGVLPIGSGVLCLSLFVVHYFVSFLVLQSSLRGRERAGCFAFTVLLMSCYCNCSLTLPHSAVGLSAVYY